MNFFYKNKLLIFIFFSCTLNLSIVYLTADLLIDNFSFGHHTISIYIQLPLLTFNYLLFSVYFNKSHTQSLTLSFYTIIPPLLLLIKYFFNEISFYEQDNLLYNNLAKYFVLNNTIIAEEPFKVQPGYPYYLSILIKIFGEQNRLTQLLNIILCFLALSIFINIIKNTNIVKNEKYFIFYLLLSSTLFLSQNILFSIAEWLTFSLGFLSTFLIKKKYYNLLAFILGYMVLLRTNLVLINSFYILLIFFYIKRKLMLLIFFSVINFSFIHNYFIHGDFSFFIVSSVVSHGSHVGSILSNPVQYTLDHLLSYVALSINYLNGEFLSNTFFISIVSLPFFLIFFAKAYLNSDLKFKIILFLLLFLSCGVTYFHGWAFYPRFQLTNYIISLIYFISLKNLFLFKN